MCRLCQCDILFPKKNEKSGKYVFGIKNFKIFRDKRNETKLSNRNYMDTVMEQESAKGMMVSTSFDPDVEPDLWVFGYGSLIWKVDFEYEYRLTGFIKGYERRFYQNSIDHRGTREKPGRVVTLVPSINPECKVWGMAYKLSDHQRTATIKHLDFREKNGYERHTVQFYPFPADQTKCKSLINLLVYVADKENDSFAGPNELSIIADQIYSAIGPSGNNREYVYMLADAMRKYFPNQSDDHLFELERILKDREMLDSKS